MKIIVLSIAMFISLFAIAQGESPEEMLQQAYTLQDESKHAEAIVAFNKYLYHHPGSTEGYLGRASSKEQLGDLNGAVVDYTLSLELLPDQYEVLLRRGAALFKSGKFEPSRADFQKLLTVPPGETNTVFYRKSAHSEGTDRIMTAQGSIKSQVYNYLGMIEVQLDQCKRAISYLDSAILLNPTDADYYVNRALARQACGEIAAQVDFKQALTLNPDHAIARHNLAVESSKAGSYQTAEKLLDEAIASDSSLYYSFVERAYYRFLRGDFSAALSDYNHALSLRQLDAEVWMNRGMVKEKLHDVRGAYTDYTEAIELQENLTKAWLNRGNLFTRQKLYAEAIEDYSAAISYQSDYAAAFYNRAIAYHRLRKLDEACSDLLQAQKLGFSVNSNMKTLFCRGR